MSENFIKFKKKKSSRHKHKYAPTRAEMRSQREIDLDRKEVVRHGHYHLGK